MLQLVRVLFALVLDVLLLPVALCLVLADLVLGEQTRKQDVDLDLGILLVHGSGFNRLQFLLAGPLIAWRVKRLRPELRVAVFAWNHEKFAGSKKATIKELAENLRPRLTGIAVRRWVFVGHSLGGLLAAELCATVEPAALVTIATPWKGAPLLDLKICRRLPRHEDMAPDSQTLAELGRRTNEKNTTTKVYCLGSRSDLLVSGTSWLLYGRAGSAEWPWLGHYSLLAWPGVWLTTAKFVAEAV